MEACTFQPDVSTSKSSINLIKRKPKVTLRVNPNPARAKQLKTEYTHLETESEVNSKIYLAPSREERERRRRERETGALAENVRDVEKAVLRMSIGRQRREFSQSIL